MKTRERIIHKALELFNEKGLGEVGVREIARALNISVGNLSYHFPKKEDILLELLSRLSKANDVAYSAYFDSPPTIDRFLSTMRQVFENQYAYRGLLVGRTEINKIIRTHFDYPSTEKRRKEYLRNIFQELRRADEIDITEKDIEFMVSFMTLFARFWIMEAFISFPDRPQQDVINHYLQLLDRQLRMFVG